MNIEGKDYKTVWMEGSVIKLIDQLKLPHSFEIFSSSTPTETADAISTMVVRGAPAIGATGGYGLAQAALLSNARSTEEFLQEIQQAKDLLFSTRPTAYDLKHALTTVYAAIEKEETIEKMKEIAVQTAVEYAEKSAERCKKIGEQGESLIKDGFRILTHCNAGALACVDYGTALAPIRLAHQEGKKIFVYADETRPRGQGASLTAFELVEEGIAHAIIADNAAGYYCSKGEIDLVITGTDRVAANGDVANKIGTYEKAVLAKTHDIPFYIAAPCSTIDLDCATGQDIPIEQRDENEVHYVQGISEAGKKIKVRISPENSKAKNPAFDVTPAQYITGIITEKGIVDASVQGIRSLFNG